MKFLLKVECNCGEIGELILDESMQIEKQSISSNNRITVEPDYDCYIVRCKKCGNIDTF